MENKPIFRIEKDEEMSNYLDYEHLISGYVQPTRRERMKQKALIFLLSLWVLLCLALLAGAAYVICGGVI